MPPLRLVLVEDGELMRVAVRTVLADSSRVTVVGEATRAAATTAQIRRLRPDVVLVDAAVPEALAIVERASSCSGVSCIVLGGRGEPATVNAFFACGAVGWIEKSIDPQDFPGAIAQIVERSVLTPPPRAPGHDLTERELTVLIGFARGLATRAVAADLAVSEKTVRSAATRIYRKIGVSNRAAAARWAHTHGYLASRGDD